MQRGIDNIDLMSAANAFGEKIKKSIKTPNAIVAPPSENNQVSPLKVINIGENISTNKWVSPFSKGLQVKEGVATTSPGRATSPDNVLISDLPGPMHPMMIVSVKTT